MSYQVPGDPNPFEAPRAEIGRRANLLGDETEAELIRRANLSHEASVKSIGSLYYLGAILQLINVILLLVGGGRQNQVPGVTPETVQTMPAMQVVVSVFSMALQFALGYGLTHLQTWARWTVFAFTILGLIMIPVISIGLFALNPIVAGVFLLVGESILGYIVYLLVSAKAGIVFSHEYKVVIEKTPHIKHKTSVILKIFLGLLLFLIVIGIVGAILSSMSR
jgi:hypothetical protein